jgi:adenosylmethionine-8-amino-7-oxononanoate aminotransferase
MGHYFSSLGEFYESLPKNDTDMYSESSAPSHPPPAATGHPFLVKAKGHYLYLDNGQRILDGCGGAAVACIGHGREDVVKAITVQSEQFSYVSWAHFENEPTQKLSDWLISSTGGRMSKVYLMCSGKFRLRSGRPNRVNSTQHRFGCC